MKVITRFIFALFISFYLLCCNDKVYDNIEIDASLQITKLMGVLKFILIRVF